LPRKGKNQIIVKLINNLMYKNANMSSGNDTITTNSSSSHIKNTSKDYSTESTNNQLYFHDDSISSSNTPYSYSIFKSNIPSYTKILVPDDGKEISNKALNQAIYLSNLSGAEIVILRIVGDVDKLGDTSVNVSQDSKVIDNNSKKDLKLDVKGELVNAMEDKIKKCVQAGSKNKISYQIKTGQLVEEIVKQCEQTNYDLIVMATSPRISIRG
jgi:nucleotide-binding universal stress UspA family protein